jgi:hypothetical protein
LQGTVDGGVTTTVLAERWSGKKQARTANDNAVMTDR